MCNIFCYCNDNRRRKSYCLEQRKGKRAPDIPRQNSLDLQAILRDNKEKYMDLKGN